jgi:serine/threonine-protein kinase
MVDREDDSFDDGGTESDAEFLREVARVDDRAPPSAGPAFKHPERIGHFHLLAEIGRGGMGVVYLAEDENLRRRVAVKLLPGSAATNEERRRRFLREARAAAAVSHPNLVTVHEIGEIEGQAYIAMEFLHGENLAQHLAARRLPVDEAMGLARNVLAGMACAHEAGLVHRDLKPGNVMVTTEGIAKVLDFGLAKLLTGGSAVAVTGPTLTHDGHVLGTPSYMSPEQARGLPLDRRTDVFSFGVVLFEMLTGRRPFGGETSADVVSSLLRDVPPSIASLNPEVDPGLNALVARCLEKRPEDRYSGCAEVLTDLDRVATARRSGVPISVSAAHSPAATNDGGLARPRPPKKTIRFLIPAVSLAAVAAAAAMVIWPKSQPTTPASAAMMPAKSPGTAITDLPMPMSSSTEALAAFGQGLQAIRDADWGRAQDRLMEAVARDPTLSSAYLRLAIVGSAEKDDMQTSREAFARAVESRAKLSERDQMLLNALEPIMNRDPPEWRVTHDRLGEATKRYPDDAELFHWYAMYGEYDPQQAEEAERRAVTLDPQFADAWQLLGEYLSEQNRVDEAFAAIDRCIAISPVTADCRGQRAAIYSVAGLCDKMEEDLRRGLSSSPRAGSWYDHRAAALYALGRPPEAVLEAFRMRWALLPASRRRSVELHDRARLAMANGRFDEADALARDGEQEVETATSAALHGRYTWIRIQVAREIGKPKDAALMAQRFLARKEAWVSAGMEIDPTVLLLRVMEGGGLITHDERVRRQAEWLTKAERASTHGLRLELWKAQYFDGVERSDEASEALALLPKYGPVTPTRHSKMSFLGPMYLRAGRPAEAIPLLKEVAYSCEALGAPMFHEHTVAQLGEALEQTGDVAGACSAYRRVLATWGKARPRSVTAEKVRARVAALRCPSEDGG